MSNLSVIQNIKEVHDYPYPYVCVEDALPENLYKELEETFPEELVTSTSPHDGGITYRYKCKEAQQNVFRRGMGMKKKLIKAALIASFFSVSSCSTYNSIVPEWAQIGSSGTETDVEANTDENNSVWWNPFSWF